MPRQGIGDLPPAPERFDPARVPECKFETIKDAQKENRIRIKSLLKNLPLNRRERRNAEGLAHRLGRLNPPTSLASPIFMRKFRRRLMAHLWNLIYATAADQVATVHIIPRGWARPESELAEIDPRTLMNQLRTDLNRAGGSAAGGWGAFFLHGEHEPRQGLLIPHIHGVVTGEMIGVIRTLQTAYRDDLKQGKKPRFWKYLSTRERDPVDGVAIRIKVQMGPLGMMPSPITYLFKFYWPSRWLGIFRSGDDNMSGRTREGRRLPEPLHAAWLRWIDNWTVDDFTLLYGVHVTPEGLQARGMCTPK